jgi:MFS family permease
LRYGLLAIGTLNAFLLYLDRTCMGAITQSDSFKAEFGLSKDEIGTVLSSFFFAYALGQVPGGWLADRFGTRKVLTIYIVLWSAFTALAGFVPATGLGLLAGLSGLLVMRVGCGLAEAGAYPAMGRTISRWFPIAFRARASSLVAAGGKLGNALAFVITTTLIATLGGWRHVLWLYGALGIVLAVATWRVFRERPEEHPGVNTAELASIRADNPPPAAVTTGFPLGALLRHRGLWFLSIASVGVNIGWAFLVTWLAPYLREMTWNLSSGARPLKESEASLVTSGALFVGVAGMLCGGVWCDWCYRRLGAYWGRRLPLFTGGALGVLCYLALPFAHHPAWVIGLCGLVAFAADSMGSCFWSYCQDIGGRYVGAVLAWQNMWGNLGASLIAKVLPTIVATQSSGSDWTRGFLFCGAGFALVFFSAWFIDARRPLEEPAN